MILLTLAEWLAWGVVTALVLFGLSVALLLVGFFLKDKR